MNQTSVIDPPEPALIICDVAKQEKCIFTFFHQNVTWGLSAEGTWDGAAGDRRER